MYLFSAYFKLNKRFEFNPVYLDYFILFTAVTLLFDRAAEQTNRNGMKVTVKLGEVFTVISEKL